MTNIKSYTDISQSKILSKVLLDESADMVYLYWIKGDSQRGTEEGIDTIPTIREGLPMEKCDIPCWSLAALLNEIPEVINFNDDENDYALKIFKENGLYYLSYDNPLEHGKIEIEPQENFIDACYEMIIKLHELNLL